MRKILFNPKNFIKLGVVALICAVLLFGINFPGIDIEVFPTMRDAFWYIREGYIDAWESEFHADVFFTFLWILILIPIINSAVTSDLEVMKSYLVIRIKRVGKWYNFKLLQIIIYSLFTSVVYHLVIFSSLIFSDHGFTDVFGAAGAILAGIAVGTFFLSFSVVLTYILSLKMPENISSFIVFSGFVVLLVLAMFATSDWVQYMPLLYYYTSWQDKTHALKYMFSYPTWSYYTVLTCMFIAEIMIGRKIAEKTDYI